ncbi:MAG: hypothetical protein ACR2PT_12220, partial [Endozoicomonas sp.]
RKSSHHGNFYAITKLFSEHRTLKQETLGAIQEPSSDRTGSVSEKLFLIHSDSSWLEKKC